MSGPCVQKDDMAKVRKELLAADLAVFVTSLYYSTTGPYAGI